MDDEMQKFSKELKKKVGKNIERILWNIMEPEWFLEFDDPKLGEECFRAAMAAIKNGDFKTPNAKVTGDPQLHRGASSEQSERG